MQPQYWAGQCLEKNARYAVADQCDKYVECTDGEPEELLCSDGLLFNDKAGVFTFPCLYPIDVNCTTRPRTQPAQVCILFMFIWFSLDCVTPVSLIRILTDPVTLSHLINFDEFCKHSCLPNNAIDLEWIIKRVAFFQPTAECPHQFGYFKLGDRANCGDFLNCAEGRGYKLSCPLGLAYNPATYQVNFTLYSFSFVFCIKIKDIFFVSQENPLT